MTPIRRPADEPEWSGEEKQRFKEDWAKQVKASGRKTPVLQEGVRREAQRILDAEARRLVAERKFTVEEVAKDHGGMTPQEEWAKTDVHKASTYSCGKCGEEFDSPQAFYDHLDAEHGEKSDG